MDQLKEVRDLILAESDSWSAAPIFYSGRLLKAPSTDHFYVGIFTAAPGGINIVLIDHESPAYANSGSGICTFASAKINSNLDRFDFVGYRIFSPGRIIVDKSPVVIKIDYLGGYGDASTNGETWYRYEVTIRGSSPSQWSHRAINAQGSALEQFYGLSEEKLIELGFFRS